MTRTVLIAGATGMLGHKIAAALQARGARVRLMVRGGQAHPKAAALQPLIANGAELVDADVANPASLARAVPGAHVIVSALQGGPDVIVDGQRALADAGLAAGVARIFPSDFSVDFRSMADEEHVFLGWRRQGDAAIATVGLPQTNTFNGAFTEMLLEPFLGLIDWQQHRVAFWGDADQPYDFTTTDDTAVYVAAAAIDPDAPTGALGVVGEVASPRQLERSQAAPRNARSRCTLWARSPTSMPRSPVGRPSHRRTRWSGRGCSTTAPWRAAAARSAIP